MDKSVVSTIAGLVVFILVCFGAAALGAMFTASSVPTWYAALRKPSWAPPNWLFGPVWTVLYLMMAIAAWLVWRRAGLSGAAAPLVLFGLQLVFNAAWTPIFFGLRMPAAAFGEIVILWALILATLLAFARISTLAAAMMAPYLAWVTFAAALNFMLWQMNTHTSG